MKSLSKSGVIAAGLTTAAVAAFTLAPVNADSPGQIEGGDIYRIKNVTQNVDFANPASANACDELEYSVRLHNSGYGAITNIVVSANLPSTSGTTNTSTLTATYQDGEVPSTTATPAVLNLSSAQSVSYVDGTTQLLDSNGNLIKALPDGLLSQSGVNIGGLDGSTTEYVNFEAKVNCPSTPPVTPPTTTTTTPSTPAPTQLVNTGPGSVIGIFAATVALGAAGYRFILGRRLSRQ